jgi:ElaB/YqjD/DUF883 family membrane-anchored ribosome-binding protein
MDQGTDTVRKDIDATRDSMTVKMEQIEAKVRGTVDDVRTSVDSTVENVKENIKQTLNLQDQVNERPLVMVGGSILAGFLLGALIGGGGDDTPRSYSTSGAHRDQDRTPTYGATGYSRSQKGSGAGFFDQFSDELETIKTAAMNTLGSLAREWMNENIPQFGEEFDRARRRRESQYQAADMAINRPSTTETSDYHVGTSPGDRSGMGAWPATDPMNNRDNLNA